MSARRKSGAADTRGVQSYVALLSRWFAYPLAEIGDEAVRSLVERAYIIPWDSLTPSQRRHLAAQWDAQRPRNLAEAQQADEDMRLGFKRVSIPRRNRRNARRPRPSRQKVSDADIERIRAMLVAEGVKPHKQCSIAYGLLRPPITLRAFKKRWTRLKKGT
jgi:hypothetical protein